MELSVAGHLATRSIEEIRRNEVLGFKTARRDVPARAAAPRRCARACTALRSEAERAVHAGYNVLCLSDKEACNRRHRPDPVAARAGGGPHLPVPARACATAARLIVQAGDVQEGHDIAVLVAFGADAVHPYLMLRLIKDGLTFKDAETQAGMVD